MLFPAVDCCRNHLGTLFELAVVGKLHFVSTVTTILFLICNISDITNQKNISQGDHKISPVKKFGMCLTSRLTTSRARVGDLVVCTHSITAQY